MFPDVPEEQRALLEPHLRNVQGHVTKMEQQYAPYKSVIDSGISGDELQGLIALNQSFNQDPVNAWLQLAANMQQQNLLSDDLDLDAVRAILEGKAEIDDGTEGSEGTPGADGDEVPQYVREMQDELRALREEREGEAQSKKAEAQQQQLEQTLTGMKAQLKEAGFTDEQLGTEEFENLLTSAIITARGNPDEALKQILALRDSTMKGLAGKPKDGGKGEDDLELEGSPKVPASRGRGVRGFEKAHAGAAQFLQRKIEAGAAE
jgi:hypothetical protein